MSAQARTTADSHHALAERLAMPMCVVSFLFLVLIGAAIQRVAGPTYRHQEPDVALQEKLVYATVLGSFWLAVIAEFVSVIRRRQPGESWWRDFRPELIACISPPLRLILPSRAMHGQIWIPTLGWQIVNRELRLKLERFFSVPMIVVALMILPVLIVEHYWGEKINPQEHLWLVLTIDGSTVVIWVAFATEFIVMCSVAENKFRYCKQHWLDLAIILLPLISFLRAVRALRLWRLGRVSRLYRLRGLAIRAFRALLLLDVIARVIGRTPAKELQRLRTVLAEKEAEVHDLKQEIAKLEAQLAMQAAQSTVQPEQAVPPSMAGNPSPEMRSSQSTS